MIGLGLRLNKLRRNAQTSAFSPLQISSLTEWFDISSLSSVGNNNPISSWAGVRGLMTLSGSGAVRPTYISNSGDGKAAAVLDGIDDTIISSVNINNVYGGTGDCETWAVVRCSAGNFGFFSTNGSIGMSSYLFTGGVFLDSPSSANRINSSTGINNGSWRILRLAKTGARRVIQAEGTTLYDASTSAGAWSPGNGIFSVGDTAGVKFNGSIRQILTFNSFLSSSDAAALNSYLTMWI